MKTKDPDAPLFKVSATDTVAIKNAPDPRPLAIHTIAVDDEGNLYCSDEFNHRILILNKNCEFVSVFGDKGNGPGQFWYPKGIAIVDNNGLETLFVCDAWNHRIQQFDLKGNFISTFGAMGDGSESFDEPVAILSDSDGDLLILDRNNGRVKKHSQNGDFISAFGKLINRNNEDQLNDPEIILFTGESPIHGYFYPEAFAMVDDGTLLIADTGNRRICHVTVDGELLDETKLDVDGKYPYSYPNLLIPFSRDVVLISGINIPLEFINTRLPLRSTPVDIDLDLTLSPACSAKKMGDGSIELTLIDCRKEVVTRYTYSFCDNPDEEGRLLPFPEDSQLQEPPNRWTEIECGKWHSYLINRKPDEDSARMARKFIDICRLSASAAAQKRVEVEGKICNMMAEYYMALDNIRKANLERQNGTEAKNQLQLLTLKFLQAKKDRDVYRKVVINAIFKAIDLATSKAWKNELTPEAAGITQLMKSEYEQRLKDYSEVIEWVKDNSKVPEKLNILAFSNAFTAIFFLFDHFSYIEKSLSKLDESFIPEQVENKRFMSNVLLNFITDLRDIPGTIFSFIGKICVELGYFDTALTAYRHGTTLKEDSKLTYISRYCEILMNQGEKEKALKTLVPVIEEVTETETAVGFTRMLQGCGDFLSAAKLIDRFGGEQQDNNDLADRWAALRRRQRLFADAPMPVLTLSTGQSSSDVLEGSSLACACGLRYVQSIEMKHPATGEPIRPYLVLPLNESQLAVVSNLKPPRELFLYTSGKGCRPLLDNPVCITGMDVTPSGDLIYTCFRNNKNSNAGSSIKIVNIESGETQDITSKVLSKADIVPYKIFFAPSGDLIAYDTFSGEILLFNEALSKHELVDTVLPGFNEVSRFGNKLVFSNKPKDKLYVYDISNKSGHFINNELVVGPTSGAFIDDSMLGVVTETGLQIYRNDEYLYQVSELVYEDKVFPLKECFCILSGIPFGGGDLLISDHANKVVHILAKL